MPGCYCDAGRRSDRTLVNEREKVESRSGGERRRIRYEWRAGWMRERGEREGRCACMPLTQRASQPGSLVDSLWSLPLLSRVKVRPPPSFSPSPSVSISFSLSLPLSVPSSFSSLSEEEQCYERRRVSSFLSNCSLLPGALPPTAHLRLDGYYNR